MGFAATVRQGPVTLCLANVSSRKRINTQNAENRHFCGRICAITKDLLASQRRHFTITPYGFQPDIERKHAMENLSQAAVKRRRGRPPQHGVQPAWMLLRYVEVIRLFDQYRDHRSKFETAVNDTVKEFNKLYPDIKISATEVRRIHHAMADPVLGLEWTVREIARPHGATQYSLQWRERQRKKRRNSKAAKANN